MKVIVGIFLGFIAVNSFAQNKKEQIVNLNYSLDSLKVIVKSEREDFNTKNTKQNEAIQERNTAIQKLNEKLKNKQNQIDSLKIVNNDLKYPKILWNGKYGQITFEDEEAIPKITIFNQTSDGFEFKITFSGWDYDPRTFVTQDHYGKAFFFNNGKQAKSSKLTVGEPESNDNDESEKVEIIFTSNTCEICIDIGTGEPTSVEFAPIQYETVLCLAKSIK